MEIKRGPRYSNKKSLKKINYIWSKHKAIKIKQKKSHTLQDKYTRFYMIQILKVAKTFTLLGNAYNIISRGKYRHTSKYVCAYKL